MLLQEPALVVLWALWVHQQGPQQVLLWYQYEQNDRLMYLVKAWRLFNGECPGVGHDGQRLKHWGLTLGQRSSESISSVLSSSKSRWIFRVLSAASHAYSEQQSSGGYSWGNNALAWGGVKVTMQTERTRLWYEPQKVLHSSSRNVSISSNSNKPHGCNNHTKITWLCQ